MIPRDSLADLFDRLGFWARFPKYALERRLDIFLTPFLADFVADVRRMDRSDLQLVLPEFPIKHRTEDNRTVNADYLLYQHAINRWLLLELKTDSASVDPKQLARYEELRDSRRTMQEHLTTLKAVRRRAAKVHRIKYARLLRAVEGVRSLDPARRPLDGTFDFLYLAPTAAKLPAGRVVLLQELIRWPGCPAPHEALRQLVARLLRSVLPPEAGGDRTKSPELLEDEAYEDRLVAEDRDLVRAKRSIRGGRRP